MSTRTWKPLFAAVLAGACTAASLEAGTNPDPSAAMELEPIVITATREERSVKEIPASVTVLPGEDVKETPALTADDFLRAIPGLNVPLESSLVQHPTANFVSMRGLGGGRALFLEDGVPINDPFFGYVQWDKVPLDDIDHVEVVRGGSSSLFGTYAMGGVTNIITRPIAGPRLDFDALYGSHKTVKGDVYGSGKITDKFGLSVNATRLKTDGYIRIAPWEQGAIDRPAASDSLNTRIKAEYQPTEALKTYLRGNLFQQQQQNQGTEQSKDSTYTRDLASGFDWKAGDLGTLQANVFYEDQRFRTTNTDLPGPDRNAEFISNVHETPATDVGASAVWSHTFGDVVRLASVGADVRQIKGEDRAHDYDQNGALVLTQTSGGRQRSAGAFGELGIWPLPRLEFMFSGRFDQWKNEDGSDDENPGGLTRFADKSKTSFNPKFSTRYQIIDAVAVRGSVYRSFRAPTLDELYRNFTASNFGLESNSQLDPELLTGADAGFDFGRGALKGQANVFLNEVKDKIGGEAVSFSPVFTLKNVNIGKTRSRGVELLEDWNVTDRWMLSSGYTYTDSVITDNPGDPTLVGKRTPDLPVHAVNVTVAYHSTHGATANLRGRYLSDRFEDDANTFRSGAAFILDAFASYPLTNRIDVYAEAENLLDRTYVASHFGGTNLGAPRQVFGGVRLSL